MDKLDDFINKYNGKQVNDPFNGYLGECVSLWKRYAQEVQGVDPADLYVPDGRAKNIWYQFTPAMGKYYDKVSSPQRGDAAIYDGVYGDVAIVIDQSQVFGQLGTPVFKPAATRSIGSPIGFIRQKGNKVTHQQNIDLARTLRLLAGESVAETNLHVEDDANHMDADPLYGLALAKQLYNGEWQVLAGDATKFRQGINPTVLKPNTLYKTP